MRPDVEMQEGVLRIVPDVVRGNANEPIEPRYVVVSDASVV